MMKMRKTQVILAALSAIAMSLLLMIPTAAAPNATQLANNTFGGLTVGETIQNDKTNFFSVPPSLATVENDQGNKVIKLPIGAAAKAGDTCAEYVVYGGKPYTVKDGSVTIGDAAYTVTEGKVTIDGTEYVTSTDALYYELCFGGGNVNKNVTVAVSEIDYAAVDKVYLQAEYFISEDARGLIRSQFRDFSYESADGKRISQSWYPLFDLLPENGGLKSGYGSKTVSGVLDKGAWNTVTVVLDVDNGCGDYYVNNRYVFSDTPTQNMPYKNLILNKDSWIVAKINKSSGDPNALAGYIRIDDAVAATYSDADLYKLPLEGGNYRYLQALEVTTAAGRTVRYEDELASTPIFCGAGASIVPKYYDLSPYEGIVAPVPGASIRLTHAAGMRFATQLDLDLLKQLLDLEEKGEILDVGIGTLIAPKRYVQKAKAFTVDALSKISVEGAKYVDVKGRIGEYCTKVPASELASGYDAYFLGSLTNIKLDNRTAEFSAVGYVKITLKNGTDAYFYSYRYDADTIGDYSKNVKDLATETISTGGGFTEEEQILLSSISNGATVMNLDSTVIRNVQYTATEFFFRNAEGVYCRLTYEGKNGWRLQATCGGYNRFDETGAGQALKIYLGEEVEDKTALLTVTQHPNKIVLNASGTDSYVELNAGFFGFGISFYTGNNKMTARVSSVKVTDEATSTADGTVVLRGVLEQNEAIYGGGERFDVVNQRGNAFRLYTRDGWNNAASTYVAIPLFVTSRGGGMFVNRYENMAVDFGKTASNEWKIEINNDLIDCYFYATGRMSDALLGYTEISGHSSLPEEWAQGEMICRYSPDLSSLEDRVEFTTYYASHKDIPEYAKYGASALGYADYSEIPNYADYYVQSVSDATAYKLISENPGAEEYNLDTLYKKDDTGAFSVAYSKVGKKYYPLGRSWATLEEIDAFGTFAYDMNLLQAIVYTNKVATGIEKRRYSYAKTEEGYRKMGPKGNPGGDGVKTIVENLINAGMKPTAMLMEPWGWRNTTTNEASRNALKETVEWLDERGIKTMLYMGVGYIEPQMKGYKEEYRVWASMTYSDGKVTKTSAIPKTSGTGENPDVGSGSTQSYIDITNPMAVDWYMNEVWGLLIDLGVDGIKIDFCETMPDEGDYGNFKLEYNWYDDSVFDGDDVHHAYSTYFISLFYRSMIEQKIAKNVPDGFVVLSRGGGIGSQRNPYLWEGDQGRTFEKIEDQLIALINSGISGVPFMTYDLAGYAYQSGSQFTGNAENSVEAESEVFARAIEFSAFTSNIQSHGDVRHVYQLTEETQEIYRRFTDIHEKLIPYIQRYSKIACDTGMPVVRAMVLEYQNDANVYNLETQYMFGEALLVAPILTGATTQREVYLPKGAWLDLLTGEMIEGGKTVTVTATLGQLPVFMKADRSAEDNNLLVDVFNSEAWQKINGGVKLDLKKLS